MVHNHAVRLNARVEESFSGHGAYVIHVTVQGTVDLVDGGQARYPLLLGLE